ncbi:YbaN family protein [Pontiella desulfatans]|nr:YbaN family protein [Pontiella desulfatans]
MAMGFVLVGLATLGLFLPLLPTTPLLLLAATCFAKSSERCHRWLLEHKVFGATIRNWHEHRCIPRKAKLVAVASILLFGSYAVGIAIENIWIRGIGGIILLIGLVFVVRLKVCEDD